MKNQIVLLVILITFISFSSFAQKIPITTKSDEALAYYQKGWELEDKLESDSAEGMYKKAIVLDSAFALAYLRLGMIKDNYDNRRNKIELAVKFIDNVSEAEKLWIKARQDFYAVGFDGSKEYSYFKKLVETYPNDEIANYLFGFTNIHHGRSNSQLAILHFKKAIKLGPNFIKPYNDLAYAYMENGNFDNAKKITKNYIKLLPQSVNPLDTYAEIFMRNGEYEKSIKNYNKVLNIKPEFPWALMGISTNMNFLGRHKEGREYIEKLREEELSDYEYRHKWRALVTSYLDEGNFKEAIHILEEQKQVSIKGINKREPKFHIYFSFLRKTRLFFENNQPNKGYKEYESWKQYVDANYKGNKVKTRLKNLEFYYRAYGFFLNNDYERAEKYLQKFHELNKKETDDSRILLSRIYMSKKMHAKAIKILNKTNLSNPYNQHWLMIAYKNNGELNRSKELRNKIITFRDRNNIDLALVRRKALALF